MYIGPWQEFKLAKLRKDAVDALKKLATLNLPPIENANRSPDQTYNILQALQAAAQACNKTKFNRQPNGE